MIRDGDIWLDEDVFGGENGDDLTWGRFDLGHFDLLPKLLVWI